MRDSGKIHHIIVPYIDENGILQEPRFGASSIGGKVIRELSAKLYELIVKAKKDTFPSIKQKENTKSEDPLQILKIRLVKGEITREEFEEMKKMLE